MKLGTERFNQCIHSIVFQYINDQCPNYINEVFQTAPENNIQTRGSFLKLKWPFRKTNAGQIALSYIGLTIWSKTLDALKSTKNLNTFKVACVINIKLLFLWADFIITKLYCFPEIRYFVWKFEQFWQAPTPLQFNIFDWNFAHVSYLPMSTKGGVGKRPGFYTLGFYIFTNNLRLNKIKKSRTPSCRHY